MPAVDHAAARYRTVRLVETRRGESCDTRDGGRIRVLSHTRPGGMPVSRNLWDIRLTLDELQDRTSYDRNLQDVAFDLTDQIDILREVLRNRWDTLVFDAEHVATNTAFPLFAEFEEGVGWVVEGRDSTGIIGSSDTSADDARHTAALVVYSSLSAEAQVRIGECP